MNHLPPIVFAVVLVLSGQAAAEPSGAAACSGCHTPEGQGPVPGLHGRPAGEIVAAMNDFRGGTREATVMDRIAKGFSDEEISAIAHWYEMQRQPAGNP